MHGMAGGSVDDFLMLKSEYIGRKLFTSGLVTDCCSGYCVWSDDW